MKLLNITINQCPFLECPFLEASIGIISPGCRNIDKTRDKIYYGLRNKLRHKIWPPKVAKSTLTMDTTLLLPRPQICAVYLMDIVSSCGEWRHIRAEQGVKNAQSTSVLLPVCLVQDVPKEPLYLGRYSTERQLSR